MLKINTIKLVLGTAAFLLSVSAYAQYAVVPYNQLNLNRTAVGLMPSELPNPPELNPGASLQDGVGFRWNAGDNKTTQWRPQGITSTAALGAEYLLVSWYNKGDSKGVRISFVDIGNPIVTSNKITYKYRHVLLVNAQNEALAGVHAGGIAHVNGKLLVAGIGKEMLVFSMNNILDVKGDAEDFHGYKYIMRLESKYATDVKTSFVSWDSGANRLVFGNHFNCVSSPSSTHEQTHLNDPCLTEDTASKKLVWSAVNSEGTLSSQTSYTGFFNEMQGVATLFDHIAIVSSWGQGSNSHLHSGVFSAQGPDYANNHLQHWNVLTFPPGLEDLHLSPNNDKLWLLTEFGPNESPNGISNNRIVFGFSRYEVFFE